MCKNKGGLKKRLRHPDGSPSDSYVHPVCALMSKNIELEDALTMTFVLRGKASGCGGSCDICGKPGS